MNPPHFGYFFLRLKARRLAMNITLDGTVILRFLTLKLGAKKVSIWFQCDKKHLTFKWFITL